MTLVRSQREFQEYSIMCFMETWLYKVILDYNSTLTGFKTIWADRGQRKSDKKNGGLAILITANVVILLL